MIYYVGALAYDSNYLEHFGIPGMRWGFRRYQNEDGSLTAEGRSHYGYGDPMARRRRMLGIAAGGIAVAAGAYLGYRLTKPGVAARVLKRMGRVGRGIVKAGQATAKVAKAAGQATAQTAQKAAQSTARVTKAAGQAVGQATAQTAEKVGKAVANPETYKKAAEKAGKAAHATANFINKMTKIKLPSMKAVMKYGGKNVATVAGASFIGSKLKDVKVDDLPEPYREILRKYK